MGVIINARDEIISRAEKFYLQEVRLGIEREST